MTDSTDETDKSAIHAGRNFEEEYRLSTTEAGKFLIELGEHLRDDDELTIEGDEWELPFAFGEPVTLEIDFDGVDDPELEVELELPGRSDENAPTVS